MTIQQLRNMLTFAIEHDKDISCASILQTEVVTEGSEFANEHNITPGAILIGIEYLRDKQLTRGTLRFEPPDISEKLN